MPNIFKCILVVNIYFHTLSGQNINTSTGDSAFLILHISDPHFHLYFHFRLVFFLQALV